MNLYLSSLTSKTYEGTTKEQLVKTEILASLSRVCKFSPHQRLLRKASWTRCSYTDKNNTPLMTIPLWPNNFDVGSTQGVSHIPKLTYLTFFPYLLSVTVLSLRDRRLFSGGLHQWCPKTCRRSMPTAETLPPFFEKAQNTAEMQGYQASNTSRACFAHCRHCHDSEWRRIL